MAITAASIAASVASVAIAATTTAIAASTTAIQTSQQNAQIKYQQEVERQNAIAAQNKAAAEMKTRRTKASRQQAATRAKMAASGVDSTSGSFLDLVGQGAAAGELDVLKAKHDGDIQAWSLNNKINELETQKKNAWVEFSLAGAQAGVSAAMTMGVGSGASTGLTMAKTAKDAGNLTSGNSGFAGMAAIEGAVA